MGQDFLVGSDCLSWVRSSRLDRDVGSECLSWVSSSSQLGQIVSIGTGRLGWVRLSELSQVVLVGSACLSWVRTSRLVRNVLVGLT